MACLLLAATALCGACVTAERHERPGGGSAGPTITLQILSTNDMHGQLTPVVQPTGETPPRTFAVGGAEALAATIAELRGRHPQGTVLLDAGDSIQGTLLSNAFEGLPQAELMSRIGYDAAVIGNHEFDFGPAGEDPVAGGGDRRGALKAWLRAARFPVLCANIRQADGAIPRWPNLRPSVILDRLGIKIGIVGVTTPTTRVTTLPLNVADLRFAPLSRTVIREARALRSSGTTVVVVVAHAGGACADRRGESCQGEVITDLVRQLPPGLVDVVVAGHTHQCIWHTISGVAVVQACARGVAVGRVELVVSRATGRPIRTRLLPPALTCRQVFSDTGGCEGLARAGRPTGRQVESPVLSRHAGLVTDVRRIVDRYRARLGGREREILGTAARPLFHRWDGTGEVGTLVARALLRAIPGADLALINSGALRADLPDGPIRFGHLYAAFPFDNKLATVQLDGEQVRGLFAALLQRSIGVPHVAGVQLELTCVNGQTTLLRLRDSAGAPLDPKRRYTVVINDFLLSGGGGLGPFFKSIPAPKQAIFSDRPIRDEIARYLREKGGPVNTLDDPVVSRERPPVTQPSGPCQRRAVPSRFLCR